MLNLCGFFVVTVYNRYSSSSTTAAVGRTADKDRKAQVNNDRNVTRLMQYSYYVTVFAVFHSYIYNSLLTSLTNWANAGSRT